METAEGEATLATEIRGKRINDVGFDVTQSGDYLERIDVVARDKVRELTEEKARKAARADMRPYVD